MHLFSALNSMLDNAMALKYILVLFVQFLLVKGLKEGYTINVRSAFDKDLYRNVLDPELCQKQLIYLRNNSLGWRFLDASAKPPPGIMSGNVNELGDYWQCLAINQVHENMQFQGKYTVITAPLDQNPVQLPSIPEWPDNITWPEIPWPRPDNDTETGVVAQQYEALRRYAMGISGLGEPVESRIFPMVITSTMGSTLGVCIPHVCTAEEAVDFFQEQVPFLNFTFNTYFYRLPNDKPFSAADYTAMVIFGVVTCLTILSTSYDLYCNFVLRDPKASLVLCRSFSVYTNSRRFLTFSSVPGAIECIDGIRAISMVWVVVGHTYSFTLLGFIHNLEETIGWLSKFSSTWINSAPITVDTFFMLSGLLAVYTTVGKISQARFIRSIHLFYLNRLLRMFPLLAAMVLLQASVLNHVSDGPFWQNISQQAENCRSWWWAALLHVQNYVNPLEICLPQSWYLSVDVQLYILCPLVLVWMFGREVFAWTTLCAILLLSLLSSTLYSFMNNFSAALANPARLGQFNQYLQEYYMNTLTRAPPFFVGMVYGYLLQLCRGTRVHISQLNVILLWAFSFAMMAFCIFSIYPVMQVDHQGQIFDNFLNAYMRTIWATALGWLIFACVHGYGGPINWFLSLSLWKLPARLSFAMYLVHVSIIMVANGSWTKTHYFSEGDNIYRFTSDITMTFLAAFVLCITIDAPFSTLQKLLMGGGKKQSQKPKTDSRINIVGEEPDVMKTSL